LIMAGSSLEHFSGTRTGWRPGLIQSDESGLVDVGAFFGGSFLDISVAEVTGSEAAEAPGAPCSSPVPIECYGGAVGPPPADARVHPPPQPLPTSRLSNCVDPYLDRPQFMEPATSEHAEVRLGPRDLAARRSQAAMILEPVGPCLSRRSLGQSSVEPNTPQTPSLSVGKSPALQESGGGSEAEQAAMRRVADTLVSWMPAPAPQVVLPSARSSDAHLGTPISARSPRRSLRLSAKQSTSDGSPLQPFSPVEGSVSATSLADSLRSPARVVSDRRVSPVVGAARVAASSTVRRQSAPRPGVSRQTSGSKRPSAKEARPPGKRRRSGGCVAVAGRAPQFFYDWGLTGIISGSTTFMSTPMELTGEEFRALSNLLPGFSTVVAVVACPADRLEITINGQACRTRSGDVALVPPGNSCSLRNLDERPAQLTLIHFGPSL